MLTHSRLLAWNSRKNGQTLFESISHLCTFISGNTSLPIHLVEFIPTNSPLPSLPPNAPIAGISRPPAVFKQGDEALNWYGVICGSLDVQISNTGLLKVSRYYVIWRIVNDAFLQQSPYSCMFILDV